MGRTAGEDHPADEVDILMMAIASAITIGIRFDTYRLEADQ